MDHNNCIILTISPHQMTTPFILSLQKKKRNFLTFLFFSLMIHLSLRLPGIFIKTKLSCIHNRLCFSNFIYHLYSNVASIEDSSSDEESPTSKKEEIIFGNSRFIRKSFIKIIIHWTWICWWWNSTSSNWITQINTKWE